jgi:hypothetical protein
MKATFTLELNIDEESTPHVPLLQRILDLLQLPAAPVPVTPTTEPTPPAPTTTPVPTPAPAPAAEPRRRRQRRSATGADAATIPSPLQMDLEDFVRIDIIATEPDNDAATEPPAAADESTPGPSRAESTAVSGNDPEEISAGEYALIAAGLRPAPASAEEDTTAALLAQAAFEFDRISNAFGRAAAMEATRSALPKGVKFTTIEALTPGNVTPVLAALRGLV